MGMGEESPRASSSVSVSVEILRQRSLMCQRNITVAILAALEEIKEYTARGDIRNGEPQTESDPVDLIRLHSVQGFEQRSDRLCLCSSRDPCGSCLEKAENQGIEAKTNDCSE